MFIPMYNNVLGTIMLVDLMSQSPLVLFNSKLRWIRSLASSVFGLSGLSGLSLYNHG